VALINGSVNLEIIFDVGINYVRQDYVVQDYLVEGVEGRDLDLGSTLAITTANIQVSAVKTAVGNIQPNITASLTATALEFDRAPCQD
jgi:hypothetical protein